MLAVVVEEVLQIWREIALDLNRLACARMGKLDGVGVQGVSWKFEASEQRWREAIITELDECLISVGVELVADDRETDGSQVCSNLVHASSNGAAAHQGVSRRWPSQHENISLSDLGSFADGHAMGDGLIRIHQPQGKLDAGFFIPRGIPMNDRQVGLLGFLGSEGGLDGGRCLLVEGNDQAA